MKYGVDGETAEVRRTALRCVANALLLDPKMRQIFVDTGYGGKFAENLRVWLRLIHNTIFEDPNNNACCSRPTIRRMKWY